MFDRCNDWQWFGHPEADVVVCFFELTFRAMGWALLATLGFISYLVWTDKVSR